MFGFLLHRTISFIEFTEKIMSHASPFAKVPEDLSEKVKSSGIGFFTPWSPQQYIITHPVSQAKPYVSGLIYPLLGNWLVPYTLWS